MAAAITTTFTLNGSRNFSARIDIVGDAAGDVTGTDIIDPQAAIANIQAQTMTGLPTKFKIKRIQWALNGFYAHLLWDATTDVPAVELTAESGELCFDATPLLNNAGAGITGRLAITTVGLAATKGGTIIIDGYH